MRGGGGSEERTCARERGRSEIFHENNVYIRQRPTPRALYLQCILYTRTGISVICTDEV